MYKVVSIFSRGEGLGISDADILAFFRLNSFEDDSDEREYKMAVKGAIEYIETETNYALAPKEVSLFYVELRKYDQLPYCPGTVSSLNSNNTLLDIDTWFTFGPFPEAKRGGENVLVTVAGGYEELPAYWKDLVLRLAAFRLDSKGTGKGSGEGYRQLEREIALHKRMSFAIC